MTAETYKRVSLRLSFSFRSLVSVPKSKLTSHIRFQVSDSKQLAGATGFEPAHVQKHMENVLAIGHNISIGVTTVKVGRSTHPSTGDGWTGGENISVVKKRVKKKRKSAPWRTQEGWRESSSVGKWRNRQCERCHAETLVSSEWKTRAQHYARCHIEVLGFSKGQDCTHMESVLEVGAMGHLLHKSTEA